MHELSLCTHLINLVREHAQVHAGSRIMKVKLSIGALSLVDPNHMRWYFELLKKGQPFEQAELECHIVPAKATCQNCTHQMMLMEYRLRCPVCQQLTLHVLEEPMLKLESIVTVQMNEIVKPLPQTHL